MIPETLTVDLRERSYPLRFAASPVAAVRSEVTALQAQGRKVAVVTNRKIATVQAEALAGMFGEAESAAADGERSGSSQSVGRVEGEGAAPRVQVGAGTPVPRYCVRSGEAAKSLRVLGGLLDFLAAERLDRTSALFVVGGGVVGDLGGFAAACYLRGIDYYQVPTTLLAMVDSSVGGKTGVNLAAGKNLVGAFHQPRGVFIGTDLLATLPPREFAAGMAEVIKTALLGDADLFERLESAPLTPASPDLAAVIRRCCALKAGIVQADERELAPDGGRALLNLGHTFGHGIEQVAGYGSYLHGEAVAIGLAAAARLSERLGYIPSAAVARIERVALAHGLPVRLRAPLMSSALIAAMARDKKVRAGTLRFIVLRSLGAAAVEPMVDPGLVASIWSELGAA